MTMRFIRTSLAAMGALAAALSPTAIPAARAQVISNIASAHWTGPDGTARVDSNRVDLTVAPRAAALPNIATYRLIESGGTKSAPLAATPCEASLPQGDGMIRPGGVYAAMPTAPAALQGSASFRAGEMLVVGMTLASANVDPAQRDLLPVMLELENGDREQITLTETAPDSGEFVGIIHTIGAPPAAVQGDCRLSVDSGRPLELRVTARHDAGIVATATLDFLVDPFGIVFDSGDGAPVTGTRVTLIDAATGRPAQVFGDDALSAYPSSILTGQRVTDAGGAVYDYPPGDYRFPFVAPGRYRLVVEPPAPFVAPSKSAPGDLAALRRPDDGQPFTLGAASYGAIFTLDSPAPVRIDIPVDRPGLPLVLRKTTSTEVAVPGDVIQYRIDVANTDARRGTGAVTVRDLLPAGMRLRADTVRADGVRIDADVAANGRDFAVTLPPIAAAKSVLLTYLAEVTVTARPARALRA
jgi:uncharacterized repeat protein (TIGR01451 family)